MPDEFTPDEIQAEIARRGLNTPAPSVSFSQQDIQAEIEARGLASEPTPAVGLTQDEIQAEIARRGLATPQETSSFSQDEIQAELEARGLTPEPSPTVELAPAEIQAEIARRGLQPVTDTEPPTILITPPESASIAEEESSLDLSGLSSLVVEDKDLKKVLDFVGKDDRVKRENPSLQEILARRRSFSSVPNTRTVTPFAARLDDIESSKELDDLDFRQAQDKLVEAFKETTGNQKDFENLKDKLFEIRASKVGAEGLTTAQEFLGYGSRLLGNRTPQFSDDAPILEKEAAIDSFLDASEAAIKTDLGENYIRFEKEIEAAKARARESSVRLVRSAKEGEQGKFDSFKAGFLREIASTVDLVSDLTPLNFEETSEGLKRTADSITEAGKDGDFSSQFFAGLGQLTGIGAQALTGGGAAGVGAKVVGKQAIKTGIKGASLATTAAIQSQVSEAVQATYIENRRQGKSQEESLGKAIVQFGASEVSALLDKLFLAGVSSTVLKSGKNIAVKSLPKKQQAEFFAQQLIKNSKEFSRSGTILKGARQEFLSGLIDEGSQVALTGGTFEETAKAGVRGGVLEALIGGSVSTGVQAVDLATTQIAERNNARLTRNENRQEDGGNTQSNVVEPSEAQADQGQDAGSVTDQSSDASGDGTTLGTGERGETGVGDGEVGLADNLAPRAEGVALSELDQQIDDLSFEAIEADSDRRADIELEINDLERQRQEILDGGLTEEATGESPGGSQENNRGDGQDGTLGEGASLEEETANQIQQEAGVAPGQDGQVQEGEGSNLESAEEVVAESSDPQQVVAASQNLSEEAQAAARESRKKNARTDNDINFTIEEGSLKDRFVKLYQNKFLSFDKAQDAIKAKGFDIAEDQDVTATRKLFHGKVESDLRGVREQYLEPFSKKVAQNKNRVTDAELSKGIKDVIGIDITKKALNRPFEILDVYLLAKHAPERNEYIASINENLPDGGSGMKTADALAIQQLIEGSKQGQFYTGLADTFYSLAQDRRDLLVDSGLLDESIVDAFQENYSNYVPLKGFYDDALEQNIGAKPGKGFSVSKETRKAKGRNSLPSSPTLNMISDMTNTVINSRKIEVANNLHNLAQEFPNQQLWEVFSKDNPAFTSVRRENKDGANVSQERVDMENAIAEDGGKEFIKSFIDGEVKYIRLNDPMLRRAWNNFSAEQMGLFLRASGEVSRYVSKTATALNPEFIITNFSRDLPNAIFNTLNLEGFDNKTKAKAAFGIIKDVFPAMGAISRQEFRTQAKQRQATGRLSKYYADFIEDGAKTGFFDSKSIPQIQKELLSFAKKAENGVIGTSKRGVDSLFNFIENVNTSIENSARLSLYANLREQGVSRQEAAVAAKELTVNFNEKGEKSSVANALFAFFNASIQGSARFIRTLKSSKKAQLAASGVSALGYTLASMARGASDEDKDGVLYYDKIPEYIKRRNIVIMEENGKDYRTIPLPYGLNFFYSAGSLIEGFANSETEDNDAMNVGKNLVASLIESFSPISIGDSKSGITLVGKTLSPTAIKPITELITNEDVFGNPIARTDINPRNPTPASSKFRGSTPTVFKDFTRFLNEASGGNFYKPGEIDISPDQLNHIFKFAIGGTGRFGQNLATTASRVAEGDIENLETRQIPFWRVINKENSPYYDIGKYYDRTATLSQIVKTKKELPEELEKAFNISRPDVSTLNRKKKSTERKLKRIRKLRDKTREDESLSEPERRTELKRILEEQKEAVQDFNLLWNEVFGTKSRPEANLESQQ